MPPPCPSFPAKELPAKVQIGPDGKGRKTIDGRPIDLTKDCQLLSLLQYECHVDRPIKPDSLTRCWPVQRWFRRCQDKKGTFMVETTAWETSYSLAWAVDSGSAPAPTTTRDPLPTFVPGIDFTDFKDKR
ncbi:hypothetical protein B0T19DRAFT_439515 [Cercophora scortea]|uniref:Uncharacterized protein n=1 Tax=Cercophora scortea TaxID=314031 RepID=A0AAE0MIA9_9PEZI|nr:hypothetical protein B0T19DRAFT_439515 [Cercophora scortea]